MKTAIALLMAVSLAAAANYTELDAMCYFSRFWAPETWTTYKPCNDVCTNTPETVVCEDGHVVSLFVAALSSLRMPL